MRRMICPSVRCRHYYYYGIVLQDLNDAIQAQDYYLRAYKLGIELERYVFLGRICANLGTLYTYQDLYSQASYFQQKAVSYLRKPGYGSFIAGVQGYGSDSSE